MCVHDIMLHQSLALPLMSSGLGAPPEYHAQASKFHQHHVDVTLVHGSLAAQTGDEGHALIALWYWSMFGFKL